MTSLAHLYVLTYVCPYVCNNLAVYSITQKICSIFFADTLGTLGQHEFAFRFCGSTRSVVAAGISALLVSSV